METRTLGRTGRPVSVIGLGCWQLGADWGDVGEDDAHRGAARRGRRRRHVPRHRRRLRRRPQRAAGRPAAARARPTTALTVATKMGRRADPHVPEAFTLDAFRGWLDRSRTNLGVDTIDLVQLHCPPTAGVQHATASSTPSTRWSTRRSIAAYGVSVETVDEALDRDRPAERRDRADHPQRVPAQAARAGAAGRPRGRASASSPGCRWPAGCCPASTTSSTTFAADDHRTYNRHGEAFDVGETFSGVPYDVGVRAAQRGRAAHARRARPPPSSPCAGSSTSPG